MHNASDFSKKKLPALAFLLICVMCAVCFCKVTAAAQQAGTDYTYINTETGYGVYIEDNAGLLSKEQKQELILESMAPVTVYGNAGFVSTSVNTTDTERYARERYQQLFGAESGTLLVVDMNRRVIALHSDGAVYKTITRDMADTIMDNVYTKASEGDYYGMAAAAFGQVLRRLAGGRISQPMKYITNAFIAVIAALLANYLLVRLRSAYRAPSRKEILDALDRRETVSDKQASLRSTFKKYSPISSSGGGGGGRSGGGGGGGGGGSHRF